MKILLVHNRYLHLGGEEQAIDTLQTLLERYGHEVVRYERASQEWQSQPAWRRIEQACQTIYSKQTERDVLKQVRRWRPDVAHVHNIFPVISPSVYRALHRSRIPVVQTIHNYRFLCANGLFLTPQGDLCQRCQKGIFVSAVRFGCYGGDRLRTIPLAVSLTLHRALKTFERNIGQFITPSEFLRQKLIEGGFPADRITMVPNPVMSASESSDRRSVTPLFLYIGRLSREKGLWTLLRAFAKTPSAQLKIIGDGPLRMELETYCRTEGLNHVEFLGLQNRAEVFRWLDRAWSLIVPSEWYETFGLVVLEAWSRGTPVIASRIGALSELIQEGQTGWLFEAGNSVELNHIITRVLQDNRFATEMSVRCQNHFSERYKLSDIYDEILDVYQQAVQLNYNRPVTTI